MPETIPLPGRGEHVGVRPWPGAPGATHTAPLRALATDRTTGRARVVASVYARTVRTLHRAPEGEWYVLEGPHDVHAPDAALALAIATATRPEVARG